MNLVRCPVCAAATWEPHCMGVSCGWVNCVECGEDTIYDWKNQVLLARG